MIRLTWIVIFMFTLWEGCVGSEHYAPSRQQTGETAAQHYALPKSPKDMDEHHGIDIIGLLTPKQQQSLSLYGYWRDCGGKINGTRQPDLCGTCGGNNEACMGCDGVPNSGKMNDCAGVCGGHKKVDCKQVCGGTARRDCFGICNGPARQDRCGICDGSNKCVGCDDIPHSGLKNDACHVCGGDNSTCADCAGVPWGPARKDECGICNGNNDCLDCNGVVNGTAQRDACGICEGDNSTCTGCDGVPFSGKVYDKCGICGGIGDTCCGPRGKCNDHGICDGKAHECICDLGWTGRNCTREQSLCQLQDCGKHGRCNPESGDCICQDGYIGDFCDFPVCSAHGLYDPLVGNCECFEGYTGPECDVCIAHPLKDDGTLDLDFIYVCTLHDKPFHLNSVTNTPMFDAPLRFTLKAITPLNQIPVLAGTSAESGPYKKVILPGTQLNGHVYGCDCLPATPEGPPVDERHENEIKKISNATEIQFLKDQKRYLRFKDEPGRLFRTIYQRQDTYDGQNNLNPLIDMCRDREKAIRGSPRTYARVITTSQADLNFIANFNLYFTAGLFTLAMLFMGTGMIFMCFILQTGIITGGETLINKALTALAPTEEGNGNSTVEKEA